ncbi:OmpA family protein [Rasiella sp. SM2506]|uniref:OmpA family protein n=1 Tax=Rasiella sp. SM2506 TaxID=3423914 RepID=UPI003D7AA94F
MKKSTLLMAMFLFGIVAMAQQNEQETLLNTEYNKWSIEFGGGFVKPSSPFADGYSVRGIAPYQASVGVRYMMNEKFGIRTNFGYASLSEEEGSLPFETSYYRATVEGVSNLGNILEFSEWTNSIGLLFHAGGGFSLINNEAPVELDEKDSAFNIVLGITPQIKISERIAFYADFSLIPNVGMERSWDGTEIIQTANRRIDDGLLYNVSAGFNIYLGSNSTHADWYSEESTLKSKIEELEDRLVKVETDLIDTDQDGVPDYLDREPNTTSGVAVNTKGIAVDVNKNGIPDELEPALDNRYVNESDYVKNQGGLNVKELLDKGYVNVYFKFNSTTPETYSLEAINYLIKYMDENPAANAELVGYADEIGNAEYNKNLSEKRANKVKEILVASGVAESRLTVTGNGEDASVEKGSAQARQLVRRVTFKLK